MSISLKCKFFQMSVFYLLTEFQNRAGNVNSGLKISRPADQRLTAIQIPTSVTTASFLKHTALTPAQRKYLYSIAASYSTEHVRRLVTQHYMNVQHRCIRADYNHKRGILFEASVASPENDREYHLSKTQSEVSSGSKNKSKTSAKHSRKPSQRTEKPGARIRLSDEEEEQGGPNDSLSECLSSLSVGGWDGDSLSDL
ncbi:protein FAM216A isoform X2 [Simochromis diagramma]|uniref:protein FAM216A isoform X2 n=1 Tax=Simochromis diagramma TaxID=43689 RepID=UPI001A7E6F40|nr:protein FAM216A isoform X2 [Simochromis diagramma]